ncbi:hypothetical protein MPSEU_000098800 [Mayamaea pseudoterrestris]|nr:hypothetical protein MPSEU_000098800 [Mayamaea pseudoterrestris]
MTSALAQLMMHVTGDTDASNIFKATVTICVLGLGYFLNERRKREPNKPWPFLPGWRPIIGHAHLAFPLKEMNSKCEKLAEKYAPDGCYEMELLGRRYIVITSEERAMEIFEHRPHTIVRPLQSRASARSTGNYGIFQAEGDEWKQDHKLVVPALNKANVKDYLTTFRVMAHRLVNEWGEAAAKGECVTIGSDLVRITSDSIASASMGLDLKSDSRLTEDVKTLMRGFVRRAMAPVCYWDIPIIGPYLDSYGGSIRRTTAMIDHIVEEYEAKGGDESKKTFLQKVYSLMQKGERIPKQRLVGNIVGLFLAGTDSTSKTLASAFYLLADDQGLQATLREESDSVNLESMSLHDFFVKIPRIKSFMHEVHRWYSVPALGLTSNKDIPFFGSTLPKGADIMIMTRAISWTSSDVPRGPNDSPPNTFDVARYLVTEEDGLLSSIFPNTRLGGFLGFGHGVRACPGRTYSEALSYVVLVAALQAFTWMLAPNHPKARFIFDVVMTPDCDVRLQLTKRDNGTMS